MLFNCAAHFSKCNRILFELDTSVEHWTVCVCTCSRTLAVSRGKVTRSAMQAAVPALSTFTPKGGGTSDGFSPTMITATDNRITSAQLGGKS